MSIHHTIDQLAKKFCVILESPCAPNSLYDLEMRQQYLRHALRDSLSRGEAPIASHGLFAFPRVLDDNDPTARQSGMMAGWAWIQHCDYMVVYADQGITPGMQTAIALAKKYGKEIKTRFISDDEIVI